LVVRAVIMTTDPPFYILCSSSPISAATVPGAPSTTLGHPAIQYHYKDDSPFALLPQTPDEQILILDWDPNGAPASVPAVRSISRNVAVTAVRVAEAPGAAAEDEVRNDRMYIIETTTSFDERCVALISHKHCSQQPHQSDSGGPRVAGSSIATSHPISIQTEVSGVFMSVLQFSQILSRNVILRCALNYPNHLGDPSPLPIA
jgi:hypothetical protein